jgi:uncharacterized protein (DUF58 family)
VSLHELDWRPAPLAHHLAGTALVALLAALILGRAQSVLLAAPLLGLLAAGTATAPPAALKLTVAIATRRCFEGEAVDLRVVVSLPEPVDEIRLELAPARPFSVVTGPRRQSRFAAREGEAVWQLRPDRWGRHELPRVIIDCRSRYRVRQARLLVSLGEARVFPSGPPVRPRMVPVELIRRIGEHTGRTPGSGVEFAGIRPYAHGDRMRDINWKASGHRGRLHVTTRADERQAEVVVVIDAFTDPGPPGRGTLDRAVRAAAITAAYLRHGDRVGVVAVGGMLRWLAPGQGDRQFYLIADAMMDAGRFPSELPPDLDRIPRAALPPRALAIVLSPLLDDRALSTINDLRRRGNPTVVIDLLDREPPTERRSPAADLTVRLWRMDRRATVAGLAERGVPVLTWDTPEPLDAVLGSLPPIPTPGRPS